MPNYPKTMSKKIKWDSPSGYVIIGKYIPPFERVLNGFGYMGVIVEDHGNGKLQCHICGEFHETLPNHLRKHKISGTEYKRRFGLLMSTALKSKRLRLRQSQVMVGLRRKYKQCNYKFKKNNYQAGNRKGILKALESKNKFGVCDLQIMERILELSKEMGKTPTLIDVKERYGGGIITLMHKRYGSYVRYCKQLGLEPNISNYNPLYTKEYFIEKALSNEASTRIYTINEMRGLYNVGLNIIKLRKIVKEIGGKN